MEWFTVAIPCTSTKRLPHSIQDKYVKDKYSNNKEYGTSADITYLDSRGTTMDFKFSPISDLNEVSHC